MGSRTILAIELKPELDASWFNGPPYAVVEHSFDEYDLPGLYRDEKEAIQESIDRSKDIHPGYSGDVVSIFMKSRLEMHRLNYPRKELLRGDRVYNDIDILHPYGVELVDEQWVILAYDPYHQTFHKILENEFIEFKRATAEDLKRAFKLTNQS